MSSNMKAGFRGQSRSWRFNREPSFLIFWFLSSKISTTRCLSMNAEAETKCRRNCLPFLIIVPAPVGQRQRLACCFWTKKSNSRTCGNRTDATPRSFGYEESAYHLVHEIDRNIYRVPGTNLLQFSICDMVHCHIRSIQSLGLNPTTKVHCNIKITYYCLVRVPLYARSFISYILLQSPPSWNIDTKPGGPYHTFRVFIRNSNPYTRTSQKKSKLIRPIINFLPFKIILLDWFTPNARESQFILLFNTRLEEEDSNSILFEVC